MIAGWVIMEDTTLLYKLNGERWDVWIDDGPTGMKVDLKMSTKEFNAMTILMYEADDDMLGKAVTSYLHAIVEPVFRDVDPILRPFP